MFVSTGGAGYTFTIAVPLIVPLVAVIVVVPGLIEVKVVVACPAAFVSEVAGLTVPTEVLSLIHVTMIFDMGLLLGSRTVAVNNC